ncbi:hypothetical protein BBJ28_00019495 [Nothophytophthora sp. Chile5]|nr:hypothetical protein BBJ28_00019495 [Nothophytophthora sp. Chile5]
MQTFTMDMVEIVALASGCLSVIPAIIGCTILALFLEVLDEKMLAFFIPACLAASLIALVSAFWSTARPVGIVIGVALLVYCILAGVFVGQELRQDFSRGRYQYCSSNNNFGCIESGSLVPATGGIAAGCIVLELVVALFLWWWRSKKASRDSTERSQRLEENVPPQSDDEYECCLSPLGKSKSTVTAPQTHSTTNSNTGGNNQRSSRRVDLWNDEAITTARIPREKVAIGELISRGGYGEVYVGTYNGLTVAVKMLLPATRKSVRHVNDFLAEVKLMTSLDHPCIVQFVGVAWDSLSDVCVLIEYMEGGDLRGLLQTFDREQHPVGFNYEKVRIALDVANALTYLHSLAPVVIHRDLKSKNILLSDELDAKLTDFGVSRERVDRTMTAGVGTSLWMAPEVLMGERYDDKADVFSFGVVLSELDLQTLPYSHAVESDGSGRRMRDTAVLQQVAMGKLRVQFSAGALKSMVDLGNACVSLSPTERPTAAEALYKLQVIQRGDGHSAKMSSAVAASVLQHVARQLQQSGDGQFTDAHGQMLAALPPEELHVVQAASELVARRAVTKVTAKPSMRSFFRVDSLNRFRSGHDRERSVDAISQPFDDAMVGGNGPNYYNCFAHYCSCAAFHEVTVATHPTAMVGNNMQLAAWHWGRGWSTDEVCVRMAYVLAGGLQCKHMVARLLADATGQFESMEIEDAHFAQMLCPPSNGGGETQ